MPPPAKRTAKKVVATVETRYIQPKGAVVEPRLDLDDIDASTPLPTWVAVPNRLRDLGYSRMTLAVAWRASSGTACSPGPTAT